MRVIWLAKIAFLCPGEQFLHTSLLLEAVLVLFLTLILFLEERFGLALAGFFGLFLAGAKSALLI